MPAILIGLGVFVLRVLYITLVCPFDLVEDEAFYWEWALRLDWSYATKGPGIAWLMWLFTTVLDGDVLAARPGSIRMIAAVSGLVTSVSQSLLTVMLARHAGVRDDLARWSGMVAALITACMPMMLGTGLIATIDGPYLGCWSIAMLAAFGLLTASLQPMHGAAASRMPAIAWMLTLGLALAAGFVMKYTIVLLVPGLVLVWWLNRRDLIQGRWLMLAGACVIGLLGVVPVAIWNSQHDWQTVRHLLGHLGLPGGDVPLPTSGPKQSYSPLWTLTLLGTQIAFAGPAIAAMVMASLAAITHNGRLSLGVYLDRALRFALACAAPIAIFYLAVSFIAEPEANWPIAAWISLVPAASIWIATGTSAGVDHASDGLAKLKRSLLHATVIVAVVLAGLVVVVPLVHRGLAAASPSLASAIGLERVIGRLMNARQQAADVHTRRLAMLEAASREPLIISQHYGRASRLRFYLPGRPIVYASGSLTGGRRVQQEYWADTNLRDPALLGRDAILIGDGGLGPTGKGWLRGFERIEEAPPLAGETKRGRPVFIGREYKGFGQASDADAPK